MIHQGPCVVIGTTPMGVQLSTIIKVEHFGEIEEQIKY